MRTPSISIARSLFLNRHSISDIKKQAVDLISTVDYDNGQKQLSYRFADGSTYNVLITINEFEALNERDS